MHKTFDIFSIVQRGHVRPCFFQSNEMKKNDCYQCPHREQVPGSAHSKCNVFKNEAFAFDFSTGVASGEYIGIHEKDSKKPWLRFHPHGVKMGWCAWPINFDPVWVECHLPIENNEKQ